MKTKKIIKAKYPKLPKAFKAKWIAALRSGKYIQDKKFEGLLITQNDEFCCLGVACRISGVKNLNLKTNNPEGLIENLKDMQRIPKMLHGRGEDGIANILAAMNDTGKSFKYIATWIEKNL